VPHQVAVTIVATVANGHTETLERLLQTLAEEPGTLPFGRLPNLHFARLFVLEESVSLDGAAIPPQLVFLCDIDAPAGPFLPALVAAVGSTLDEIFGHCVGYPPTGSSNRADRVAFLQERKVRAAAAYTNTVGRSVEQIRQEAELRRAVEDFLDRSELDRARLTPTQIRAAVRDFVLREESLRWARRPARAPELWWRAKEAAHAVIAPLVLLLLLPALLLVLPVWAVLLRVHERSDVPEHPRADPARVEALTAMEDHVVQNPFTAVGFMKLGPFRRLTLDAVLRAVSYGVRHVYNRGRLSGIRTIHFARWVFIDGQRRLFFASNYDGSQESYMDDFIDKVAWGLNAVFSNGNGYPRTNWLVRDGAKDEETFKNYLRVHQVLTPVWYSAYPDLTAVNIENNARIRSGLYGDMTIQEAATWLGRF
jgi:hypothetical protein